MNQAVEALEKSLITVPTLVCHYAQLTQICIKKIQFVLPNAPMDCSLILMLRLEAADKDAHKGLGLSLNLKDVLRHVSQATLVEMLPISVRRHAWMDNLLIQVQVSVN